MKRTIGYLPLLLLSSATAECERDGITYAKGRARIGIPLQASCSNFFTPVNVYESCGLEGQWEIDDAMSTECWDGEKYEIQEGIATCVFITCETNSGTVFQVFDQVRAPGRDSCHGSNVAIEAYDECSDDGGIENQDEFTFCGFDEHCVDQRGCIPIQCEADGVAYEIGSRIRTPQYDSCQDTYTQQTGYQVCNSQGEWEDNSDVYDCFDGEKCEVQEGIATCVFITCETNSGTVLQVFEQVRASERDGCHGSNAAIVANDECSDDRGIENQDEIICCGFDEHCVDQRGCIPI